MKRILFLAMLAAAILPIATATVQSLSARARSLDGDTIAINLRLAGIDAFERHQQCEPRPGQCQPCGKQAQDYLARLLRDRDTVIVLRPESSHGRPVVTASVAGHDIGLALIEAGLAIARPDYLRDDPARATRYRDAYRRALAAKRGAFGGRWIDPARWRRGERLACEKRQ